MEETNTTTKKNKATLIYNILLGGFFITLLYCFELVPNFSEQRLNSEENFFHWKKKNKLALDNFKEAGKELPEYKEYLLINKEYNKSVKNFKKVKNQEMINGFKSLQLFIERLLPNLALLIYFIFNLYRSFRKEPNNIGIKLIHGVFIMYAFFQLFWIFQQFQDFSKPIYYLITAISAYLVGLAIYCIRKQEVSALKRLRKKLLTVSYYSLRHTEGENNKKMQKVLREVTDS